MPPVPAAPWPRRRTPDRIAGAVLVLVLLLGAGPAPRLQAEEAAGPATRFTAFESAWKGRSPDDVVGCMDAEGTVVLQLLGYPLSGRARSMKPEQAKATLKAYFKKIASMRLEDVSPEKSPDNVRLYEYTYKPEGENARTTHLRVQLKQDKNRPWVLAAVNESVKPRE